MRRQVKRDKGLPKPKNNFSYVRIPMWVVVIVLLTAADGASETAAGRPVDPLQSKYLRFNRLTAEDGLSGDQAYHVAQDSYGFMWFATANGLSRYDGSSVKVYRHDPDDPHSLGHNAVRAMIVDQSGNPWLGTWGGGLNKYDRGKDAFIRYQHDPGDPHSLSSNLIRAVYADRSGIIWVGTAGGLNKLDREKKQFTHYLHDPDDPKSLSHNLVWSILEDSDGVLWVGTEDGFNRFDPTTEQFIRYRHNPDDLASLSHITVREIFEDRSGILWLSTHRGLSKFNRERSRFTRYLHDTSDPQTLSNNLVTGVYEDRAGRLWVSTWGGGLNRFDRETETFTHYRHDPADPYSLGADTVFQVYEDQQGIFWIASDGGISVLDGGGKPFQHYRSISYLPNTLNHNVVRALHAGRTGIVWVGTSGGGLNKFDRHTETFTHYQYDPADPNSLSNDSVRAIYEDRMGLIWVGTSRRGLNRFDPETERFTLYQHDAVNPRSISKGSIMGITEDRTGTLWISTWGGGVNAFDRESEQFTRYQHDPADPNTLSHDQVIIVLEDRAGELWIGTFGGLNRFHRETKTFTRYQHVATNPQSLVHDSVTAMYEDRTGTLWIGTLGGLDKYNSKNDQFTHYTTANGLPSELIWGILEDEQGRLWLSTANGLSRFDPQTESFRNYSVSDGLQSDTFLNFSAYSKSQSGEMFFGGSRGFNAFYPDQVLDNLPPPPVLITDFQLANKPVPIGTNSVLKKSILETDTLVLSYLDRVFSFEFAALNYQVPEKNRYKYKMEGFEEAWNEVDSTRRFATYTNLDAGEYVFRVIASNNDGIWNKEGASLRITITPPWWETLWFRLSLVVVAMGLLVGGYRWRLSAIEAISRELEIQVERRTQELEKTNKELEIANKVTVESRDAAEAANQAKSIFLTNMSHELRTPLHAILGFVRLLTRDSGLNREQRERLEIINRSGEHLLGMVDDILSLSKIEAGRIELKQEPFDIAQMLQDVGQMVKSRAEGKGLSFILELDPALPPSVQGDAGKLRQVLINLLGNAVKFTETGEVWLRARSQAVTDDPHMVMLQLDVQDSGPGIPREKLDEVFDIFAQLDRVQNPAEGTGLGLAISQSLVGMMNGEIRLESEEGQGALFRVRLPFHLAEAGVAKPSVAPVAEVIGLQAGQPEWRILVVDDNHENRLLLRDLMSNVGFKIQEAKDGEEAMAKFQEWQPHLIWMDMRMPVLDGYAATKQIRALAGGEAVKIVAVTASVLVEQREEILNAGCDDVVRKPFRDHEIFEAMARQLDVHYRYKAKAGETDRNHGRTLSPEMLRELPRELLEELRRTILVLDREATLQIIERIATYAPETAETLRTLVEDFQMDRLGELLGEVQ